MKDKIEEVKEKVVIQLMARDERITIGKAAEFWDRWQKALNEPPYANDGHFGDCTNDPSTCMRCLVEDYIKDADRICQMFEPQTVIDITKVTSQLCTCGHEMMYHYFGEGCCDRSKCNCMKFEPKPDEDRLLTNEEMAKGISRPTKYINWQHEAIAKAQDAKTAPIAYKQGYDDAKAECQALVDQAIAATTDAVESTMEALCQERVRGIVMKTEDGMAKLAGYPSREEMLRELELPPYWQAIKKQEGIE